jgi:hypothetical protein
MLKGKKKINKNLRRDLHFPVSLNKRAMIWP